MEWWRLEQSDFSSWVKERFLFTIINGSLGILSSLMYKYEYMLFPQTRLLSLTNAF
jgi:hypothetical protein